MKVSVAIIGVGNMGGGMARRLLACGWPVRVHDIDASKAQALQALGAIVCFDAAQAALGASVVIVCVVDAVQTEAVLFGGAALAALSHSPAALSLQAGQTVLLCPTIAPHDVERFAARLHALGVDAIDAPMSGGPARAAEGTMSLMLAGPAAALARCEALLQDLSSKRFVVSERPGDGARTKLVNNLLAGINLVGAAEAIALAERLGLDPSRMLDVIEQSSGQSWIGSDRMRRAIAGDFEPRAHVTLLQKDTALAVAMAQAAGFTGPLGAAARDAFAQAAAAGLSGLDDAALLRWLRERVSTAS